MILSVENGTFAYGGKAGRKVLDGIGFSVKKGEILAILGPNGAGKTTLLRCTMGFLPWTQGESRLDGTPFSRLPAKQLWEKLAYVPQARGKASGATVEDTVLLGRAGRIGLFRQPGRADRAATGQVLRRLGLWELRARRCDEISGGELQMTLIARALAAQPECIILDEPESNLDFKNQLIVLNTLQELREEGIACVFNTHYPEHALRCADRALLLKKDGTHRFGSAAEVVTEETIAAAFGVRSVIGELETDTRTYRDVLAVSILSQEETAPLPAGSSDTPVLAAVTMLLNEKADTEAVNALLHEYGEALRGRFGMPCRERGVHMITVTADAPRAVLDSLVVRLGRLAGVSVKATYPQI